MENANQNTYIMNDNDGVGSVQIADEVVAMIATLAAAEVEGVNGVSGSRGSRNPAKGVKVVVSAGQVSADLSIEIKFGYNIPETSAEVQTRVKNAIESMTGLTVTNVDIRIAGVDLEAGKQ